MDMKTLTKFAANLDEVIRLPLFWTNPLEASSRDYGFDFDPEELASGLTAPLPADACIRVALQDAEQYDTRSLGLF